MNYLSKESDSDKLTAAIEADIQSLLVRNTPAMRAVRRKYSQALQDAPASFVIQMAKNLCKADRTCWMAYELIREHRKAFACLGEPELEELGRGIHNWWTADAFARTLSGPAWLLRQVSDELIIKWAGTGDLWWRRVALVSTVALNVRSQGGTGYATRTLCICRILAGDQDEMVAKALSWDLRELVVQDPGAVQAFLDEHEQVLAALVKREVRNKLRTGLKNPGQKVVV